MTPLDIARALYCCVDAGDWAGAEAYMANDLVIREPEPLPYAGEWRGKDALTRLFLHVMGYWDAPRITRTSLVGDDRLTVTLMTLTATSKTTGNTIAADIAEVMHMRDGRISEIVVNYFDPVRVAREAGPRR